jgi:hypothetical protein
MSKVVIPFREEFREKMLKGFKTATTRMKKYGDKGDTFEAFGATFEIVEAMNVYLSQVATWFFESEGFETRRAFVKCWKKIHPKKGYDSGQVVWLHLFQRRLPPK